MGPEGTYGECVRNCAAEHGVDPMAVAQCVMGKCKGRPEY